MSHHRSAFHEQVDLLVKANAPKTGTEAKVAARVIFCAALGCSRRRIRKMA